MNMFLWVLQVLLALHTLVGAVWKFSNSEQAVTSLQAIPHGVWMALSVVEIVCALFLLIPIFKKRLAILAPIGAAIIAAEMLLFCGVHLASGDTNNGPMIYWLVTAIIAAFVSYGRYKLRPLL
jgi:heme/copper-type cytochrome/quinol oxidase subunit 4